MKLVVLGAGAWGTALAVNLANQRSQAAWVTLCTRRADFCQQLRSDRENRRYLPGVALPETLQLCASEPVGLRELCLGADLVVLATPMAALREMLQSLRDCDAPVVWLCKGFEASRDGAMGLLGHEVQAQVAAHLRVGVLSGPSFALEVAQGLPSALVAASTDAALCQRMVEIFHGPQMRVYASQDVIGVEVGGALKNVMAIAAGVCDGLNLGQNARAALITRGLAEMTRLGLALGANAQTFMGLSGLGDLVLTATGDLSRNRQVGLRLAAGQPLAEITAALGHVAEGVYSARTVAQRARHLGVAVPVTDAVVTLLDGQVSPAAALATLMAREPVAESQRPH